LYFLSRIGRRFAAICAFKSCARRSSHGPEILEAGLVDAVIRVYDDAGNVIETHEYAGDFKEW
jgi:hypothetical protein